MKHMIDFRKIIGVVMVLSVFSPIIANGKKDALVAEKGTVKKINVFSYQFDNKKNQVQVMANAYMAKHPDVEITVEEYPWDAYWENVEVRFSAKNPNIDVIVMDIPSMAGFADRGFIEDMTKYIPASEFSSKVAEGTLKAITYNGKVMAAPLQNSDQYLYINADMAAQAGVKLPAVYVDKNTKITEEFSKAWGKGGWNWDETVAAAQKMKKDSNGDGITDIAGLHIEQSGRLYQLQPLGGSRSGRIVSPDGKTVKGYLDQEVWIKAVQFYSDLFNKYKVEDPTAFLPGRDERAMFVNGKFAMMIGGGWNLRDIMATPNLNVVVAAHPYFSDGKCTTPTGSWITGIAKNTAEENKKIAADFLAFWTLSQEGTSLWYDIQGELPATKYMLNQLATSPKFDVFPLSAQRLGVYQVLNTAEGRPVTPFFSFVNAGFDKAFIDAAQGKDARKSLMDAVDQIENEIARVK